MDEYIRKNREVWDGLASLNVGSEFYDNEAFKRGKCTLDEIELDEVGDVSGKSLLHLQCHFGQDTLSWARLGASVTGVDFSPEAIAIARSLARELKLAADFVCCELNELPQHLTGEFDIVFTSGGVLPWLPDLSCWGEIISNFLKPGGFFYIREFHPTAYIFDDAEDCTAPRVTQPYFPSKEPLRFENQWGYAGVDFGKPMVDFEWPHSLAEIINSLIEHGLRIEYLHEFPFSSYRSHPFLRKRGDGRWYYPDRPDSLPLMFSLKAVKPRA